MRIVSMIAFFSCACLSAISCIYVHDGDCQSNSDCKSGRICRSGTCVGASETSGSGGGEGNTGGSGGMSSSGPSCYTLHSGFHQAARSMFDTGCPSSKQSVPVQIASGGLVTSVDGRACTLVTPGDSCYDIF